MRHEGLLNKRQVCAWLGIRPSTLDKLLAEKRIPVVRFNRRVLFDPDDIRKFINSHKKGGKDEVA